MIDTPRMFAWLASMLFASLVQAQDLAKWTLLPADWKGATVTDGEAVLTADKWSLLVGPDEFESVRCEATVTINEPAKHFGFFGSSWTVWPDRSVPDGGFEVAIVLHASKDSGYRVQWSHTYQEIALVKYPDGGQPFHFRYGYGTSIGWTPARRWTAN